GRGDSRADRGHPGASRRVAVFARAYEGRATGACVRDRFRGSAHVGCRGGSVDRGALANSPAWLTERETHERHSPGRRTDAHREHGARDAAAAPEGMARLEPAALGRARSPGRGIPADTRHAETLTAPRLRTGPAGCAVARFPLIP